MSEGENLFKELPEKLKTKFLNFFQGLGDINEFEKSKGKSIIDLVAFMIKYTLEFLQDKQKLKEFLQIVPDLIVNYDKLFINSEIIDKEHYTEIQNNLITASQINKERTIEICTSYSSSIQTKFPLQDITYSTLIFRDFIPDLYKLMESTPIKEYSDKFAEVLYKMIESNQKDQFQLYFFDWALKFGYLIEAYIKEFLISQLKLRYLLNNEDFNNIANKNRTIGQLLRTLEKDNGLAFMRNAIFHTNFILEYHIDFDQRKIIFKDWEGKIKILDINEFVGIYFKLYQLIQTEILAFSFFFIRINERHFKLEFKKLLDSIMKVLENIDLPESLSSEDDIGKFTAEFKKILKNGLGFKKF